VNFALWYVIAGEPQPCPAKSWGGHLYPVGNVNDHRRRDLVRSPWEPSLQLEKLEQDGEAETGGARLVGDQLPVVFREGPGADDLFRNPTLGASLSS
jgi:hypothetical protein